MPSKFNVSEDKNKRTYNSFVFDSAMEMKFYRDVVLPQVSNGNIIEYELQKPYILQEKFIKDGKTISAIKYVADFYLKYKSGDEQVIDIKGYPDSLALLKRKLFWYRYPDINYVWITYSKIDGGWCTYEEVKENRKRRKKEKENKQYYF